MDNQNQQKISWNKSDDEDVYRGTTAVASHQQNDHLNFAPQPFGGKGAASSPFGVSSDQNALDIYGGSGPSFPIQPMGMKAMQQPILEVMQTAETQPSELKNDDSAPLYDGFQSLYAHHSRTKNPVEMVQSVGAILKGLSEAGAIDFHQSSAFVVIWRFLSMSILTLFYRPQSVNRKVTFWFLRCT